MRLQLFYEIKVLDKSETLRDYQGLRVRARSVSGCTEGQGRVSGKTAGSIEILGHLSTSIIR